MGCIVGWDVSTSVIGVAAIDGLSLEYVALHHIDLGDFETMQQKYLRAAIEIDSFIRSITLDSGKMHQHVIEDRLMGFSRGMTTQNTLMKLSAINAVVTFILLNDPSTESVSHMPPVTAKSRAGLKVPKGGDKKATALELLIEKTGYSPDLRKKVQTPKQYSYDIADAFVVAWAVANGQKQKARGSR
jgi:hypothetical protein